MSMYNMLFGQNQAAPILMAMLNLTTEGVGRYRDCYLDDDNNIVVHTRNGGGNRADYAEVFSTLRKHPQYTRDTDDDYDCTYADIVFRVPPKYADDIVGIPQGKAPSEKWQALLAGLRAVKP